MLECEYKTQNCIKALSYASKLHSPKIRRASKDI